MLSRFIALPLLLASVVPGAAAPTPPPKVYRVDGRPVPASCLEPLATGDGDARGRPIDLRSCGIAKRKPHVENDGSIGYELEDGGYFYYSYLGRVGGVDILSLASSGGGSGRFTQLIGIRRDGRFLRRVRDYGGGDRCNGGIANATVTNGSLRFDQAITPYDLIALTNPKQPVEAYKDLEASAASCVGLAHMVGDDSRWTGVTLDDEAGADQGDWTEKYTYQPCFNRLLREMIARRTELDRTAVFAFAKTFARTCVVKP